MRPCTLSSAVYLLVTAAICPEDTAAHTYTHAEHDPGTYKGLQEIKRTRLTMDYHMIRIARALQSKQTFPKKQKKKTKDNLFDASVLFIDDSF